MAETRVGPHGFERLRRFRNKGRCRTCLLHERYHGDGHLPNWPLSRAVGDRSLSLPWHDHFPGTKSPDRDSREEQPLAF
jgi:hypothetical protein